MHGSYSPGLTLERVDVNGPYSKANCTWVTPLAQQSNKRNNRKLMYQGQLLHLAEITRRSGVSKMKLTTRLNRGMSADEAVQNAKASTYGTGRTATKGRMFTTSSIAVRGISS
jgi:hypothetical protein